MIKLILLEVFGADVEPEAVLVVIADQGKVLAGHDFRTSDRIVNCLHPVITPGLKETKDIFQSKNKLALYQEGKFKKIIIKSLT